MLTARTMRRAFALFGAIATTFAICAAGTRAQTSPPDPIANDRPTFNANIGALIHRRCATCHREGQAAPMSLVRFAEVRPWVSAIRREVEHGRMPPWPADPRFGTFANDRRLHPDERALLLRWIDGGAPEGNGPAPTLPAVSEQWTHPSGRPPDVVLEMAGVIDIPPGTVWPTFNVYSALPEKLKDGDHFVQAVQLLPGNRRVTHHSSLSTRRFPDGVALGSGRPWPGGPLLSGLPIVVDPAALRNAVEPLPTAAGAFSSGGVSHLSYFFPGNDGFVMYPASAGKRIPAADHLEWSIHYTSGTTLERDRHLAGFWLHPNTPANEVITLRVGDFHIVNGEEIVLPAGVRTNPGHAAIVDMPGTCDGRPCMRPASALPPIPAGQPNWRITGITPVLDDVTLFSASPHGHLRLKDMAFVVTYPDGEERTVLHVPRYDFNWQFVYRFTTPLAIPAGSTIKTVAHYDNSSAHRANPDPTRAVQWSEQSTDEMFNGFVDLAIDRFGALTPADAAGPRPTRSLVTAAGCVVNDKDGRWWLTDAAEANESDINHADAAERALAQRSDGSRRYRLIGTADFVDAQRSLAGERSMYLTEATANATGQLVAGRSVAVKGVLVSEPEPAINLVSVWTVPGSCRAR